MWPACNKIVLSSIYARRVLRQILDGPLQRWDHQLALIHVLV